MHFFWNFFRTKKKNNMSEHSNLRLGEYKKYKKINKTMEKKKDSQKLRWQCFERKNLRLLTFFCFFLMTRVKDYLPLGIYKGERHRGDISGTKPVPIRQAGRQPSPGETCVSLSLVVDQYL